MTRVLIVDDAPGFRRQLMALLTHEGLDVVGEAQDIPEAENQVSLAAPDLAIVDLILPGISGLEGIPLLKRLAPAMRVILISGVHDDTDMIRSAAREAGAETFIVKDDLDPETVRTWKTALE